VLADGIGRIFHAAASPVGSPWMWTLIFDYHEGRTHGYEATREAAMAAFAKSWRREGQMRPLVPIARSRRLTRCVRGADHPVRGAVTS
jgi:hypothetical protein